MIALSRAVLCLDDELLYDGTQSEHCPHCGSRQTVPIARWLNRERKPVAHVVTRRRPKPYRSKVRG